MRRRSAGVCLILSLGLWLRAPLAAQGETLTVALDRARREPILDGQGAAGIRLGDTEEAVITALGLPGRIKPSADGLRRAFLYTAFGPQRQWTLDLQISFRQAGAEAIHIVVTRRPSEAGSPYQGRTSRGYQPGDPEDRLRALYGVPDEVIPIGRGPEGFWWYRAAGLLVFPGRQLVEVIVVRPHASPTEVRRQVRETP